MKIFSKINTSISNYNQEILQNSFCFLLFKKIRPLIFQRIENLVFESSIQSSPKYCNNKKLLPQKRNDVINHKFQVEVYGAYKGGYA